MNWSNIARPVFLSAVAEFEHRKGQSMETSIERLRASKAKFIDAVSSEGKEAGRIWARDHAEFDELERVAALDCTSEWVGAFAQLRDAIDPNQDLADDELGAENHSDEYAAAFIGGAQEFYEEVRTQL